MIIKFAEYDSNHSQCYKSRVSVNRMIVTNSNTTKLVQPCKCALDNITHMIPARSAMTGQPFLCSPYSLARNARNCTPIFQSLVKRFRDVRPVAQQLSQTFTWPPTMTCDRNPLKNINCQSKFMGLTASKSAYKGCSVAIDQQFAFGGQSAASSTDTRPPF